MVVLYHLPNHQIAVSKFETPETIAEELFQKSVHDAMIRDYGFKESENYFYGPDTDEEKIRELYDGTILIDLRLVECPSTLVELKAEITEEHDLVITRNEVSAKELPAYWGIGFGQNETLEGKSYIRAEIYNQFTDTLEVLCEIDREDSFKKELEHRLFEVVRVEAGRHEFVAKKLRNALQKGISLVPAEKDSED